MHWETQYSQAISKGRDNSTSYSLPQFCLALCRPLSLGLGRGFHRACVSPHHVHVLYIPGAGGGDAHHVVNRQRESDYIWPAVIWCFAHSHRSLCIVAVAHV